MADSVAPAATTPIYDISGEKPVLGDISHDEVQDAVTSGRYSLPKGSQINVLDPDGQMGIIDAHEAPDAFKNGYQYATPKMMDDFKNSSFSEQAKAFGEGAASGLAGPIGTGALKVLGDNPVDMVRRSHTIGHGLGQAAGLVGGAVTGTGEAALMEGAGKALAEGAGLAEPVSYAAKVGSEAVQQAAQMSILQGGDEISKAILQDPDYSAESAISNIGMATALGGAAGAFVSGVATPLWDATAGPQMDKFLTSFKDHLNGIGKTLPEDVQSAANTLGVEISPELKGAQTSHSMAQRYNELKEVQNPNIINSENELKSRVQSSILEATGKPVEDFQNFSEAESGRSAMEAFKKEYAGKSDPITKQFDGLTKPFEQAPATDAHISNLADRIVQKGYEKGWIGKDLAQNEIIEGALNRIPRVTNASDMKRVITEIGNLAQKNPQALAAPSRAIIDLMMDTQHNILGDAINLKAPQLMNQYTAARAAYSQLAKTSERMASELSIGRFGGPKSFLETLEKKLDPEAFLRRLSPQGKAEFIPFMKQNFPETLSHIQSNEMNKLVSPAVKAAKNNDLINVKTLQNAIKSKMAGQPELLDFALPRQLIDRVEASDKLLGAIPGMKSTGTAGWHEKLSASVPHSAMAAVAMMTGHNPFIGGVIGHAAQLLRRNVPDAIKLGMLRFVAADQPVKAQGFKAMVDFLHNSMKGQTLLVKSVGNVFKSGSQVLADNMMPNKADREKLDKMVAKTQANPETITQMSNGQTGHYLPDHQAGLSKTTTQTLQYLQQLKPKESQSNPLDRKTQPDALQVARYTRALNIAQQPMSVLQHVKDGTLQASDVKDLSTMYPGVYKQVCQKLTTNLAASIQENTTVPYKTRMSVSLLCGQPLDQSMNPLSIQAAQPKPQSPQSGPSQTPKPKRGTASLEKMSKGYQTQTQSAEADRGSR